jgi:aspartate/methionine/tyrosine aminotransferase
MIHMGIGEPDFTAAPAVIEAAHRAMLDGKMQYTSATGLPALRAAIAAHYLQVYGLHIAPSRIVVTAGASAALLLACAALVERGAQVLMPDPSYPCNRHFVAAFDGEAKMIASGPETRFQLTGDMVREHWSASTRGVLLASPSNPTGTSILPDELARIVDVVRGMTALPSSMRFTRVYRMKARHGLPWRWAKTSLSLIVSPNISI